MRVEREWLRWLVFGRQSARRFTQESPVLPEVWLVGGREFARDPTCRVDLLLTPHREQTAGALGRALRDRLEATAVEPRPVATPGGDDQVITRRVWSLAVSTVSVAVSLTLDELVTAVLPLTPWWQRNRKVLKALAEGGHDENDEVAWMRHVVGTLLLCVAQEGHEEPAPRPGDSWVGTARIVDGHERDARATNREHDAFLRLEASTAQQRAAFVGLLAKALRLSDEPTPFVEDPRKSKELVWSVSLNRRARTAIRRSVSAAKADAARRLFSVDCHELAWAVVDTGIDAGHPAFRSGPRPELANGPIAGRPGEPDEQPPGPFGARVRATYDFTRLRSLVTLDSHPSTGPSSLDQGADLEQADRAFKQMRRRLRAGQPLDWTQLEPLLRVHHEEGLYRPPGHDHGTHVAGILAARETEADRSVGMCPDINLYDLRVLDDEGKGDEFSIIAALQFIRYLNTLADQPVIHGVNLSLSLVHDVENFACGRTPICEECERLVASGVVVVAAAGNRGFERVLTAGGELEAFRAISITDPGNADGVITVGATHRYQPHTYGVSYFSSRGPTGDGRVKPDLLAPGERIYSSVLGGGYAPKDGTSMAAPHVSGAAALLMARHREFLGQPAQVKRILMQTATDLGRERYFQGAGMVDALRALQSV